MTYALINLIDDVYESKKIIFRLLNMPKDVQSMTSLSLLPYLAMIYDGIDILPPLGKEINSCEFAKVNGQEFTKLIKKVRVSSKLLTDKKALINQ